jgi:hypothetical protein
MRVKAKMKRLLVSRQCKDYTSRVNQEPLQMPSCEPPAALNTLLWPVVAPKNRVGGSPVFSFVFTFQYIGETLDTPSENGGCGYAFASGVHKYLYGADNPVMETDPSGHDDVMAAMEISAGLDALPGFSITPMGAITGSGTCGSDVTKQLQATLDLIESDFKNKYNDEAKKKMCLEIVGKGPDGVDGAKSAWYIPELSSPSLLGGYTPPAGLNYGSGFCRPSVAIDGRCYYTYSANYAMWGKIMKLSYDYMKQSGQQDDYTLDRAIYIATTYKYFNRGDTPFSLNTQQALAFTKYGYTGSRSSLAEQSISGAHIEPNNTCTISGAFDYAWLPVKYPRYSH